VSYSESNSISPAHFLKIEYRLTASDLNNRISPG